MKISVIGAAGNVGSCAACNIALHKVADEVVMIDDYSPDGLDQYAFDLQAAVTGLDAQVRKGSYEDLYGSDIIIMAAGSAQIVASRQEVLPRNLPLVVEIADRIKQCCPETVLITATNPVCPPVYAMCRRTGFDRMKVLGCSANDSVRFRMFVAQALGVPASRVQATVIGEHGDSQVLLFSSVLLGHGGVREIPEWSITPEEHEELERSVEAIRPLTAYVDDFLKNNPPKTLS